jgi:DNA polymerase-3 subunit gamma/tau
MMATTQPEDIPQTVRSRCQVFHFHAVKLIDILAELRGIADHEGVHADDAALSLLAEAGDGSMRDALSIMDQAIASAPTESGHPRLDAGQIRELMGAVPNATFERILSAVDQNRSAEVMTIANELMDAGNSPAQLARQCVRYLRSCVIAKIAGLAPESDGEFTPTELLQISPDEQRRAARTAALFTEEELTRFLQTMLRTFDELGYRQEQRFHFELGLLKLVHLRRLLPVEEVLSSLPAPAGSRAQASVSAPRPTANLTAPVVRPPTKPAFLGLDTDKARRFTAIEADRTPLPTPATLPTLPDLPVPAPVSAPAAASVPPESGTTAEGHGLSRAATDPVEVGFRPGPLGAPGPTHLQTLAVAALSSAPSQTSAADAIHESTFTLDGNTLTIQTQVSATMLPMIVNPDAERILKSALREAAPSLKLAILPGAAAPEAARKPRAVRAGSAESRAREHPMIQQAQQLFDAEIRNVIDLSEAAK